METILIAKVNWEKIAVVVSLIIIFGGALYALFATSKQADEDAEKILQEMKRNEKEGKTC